MIEVKFHFTDGDDVAVLMPSVPVKGDRLRFMDDSVYRVIEIEYQIWHVTVLKSIDVWLEEVRE